MKYRERLNQVVPAIIAALERSRRERHQAASDRSQAEAELKALTDEQEDLRRRQADFESKRNAIRDKELALQEEKVKIERRLENLVRERQALRAPTGSEEESGKRLRQKRRDIEERLKAATKRVDGAHKAAAKLTEQQAERIDALHREHFTAEAKVLTEFLAERTPNATSSITVEIPVLPSDGGPNAETDEGVALPVEKWLVDRIESGASGPYERGMLRLVWAIAKRFPPSRAGTEFIPSNKESRGYSVDVEVPMSLLTRMEPITVTAENGAVLSLVFVDAPDTLNEALRHG